MNQRILILYGTVTGNAEICANQAAERLKEAGCPAEVKDIFDVQPHEVQKETTLLICISTYGEGDPPDAGVPMWEGLVRDGNYDLCGLRFSVLGLGDSGYEKFCQCGKDFDAALERQGAQRIATRVDADVDYKEPCAAWIESVVTGLKAAQLKTLTAACVAT